MGSPPDVSIIIPSYNAKDFLRKALNSIQNYMPGNYEVIVIDDVSTDDSVQMIKDEFSWVTLLQNEKNSGPVTARHRGIQAARSPLFFFIDSDIEIKPGAYEALHIEMENDPHLAFVTCNKCSNDGYPQRSWFAMPTLWNTFQNMIPWWRRKLIEGSTKEHETSCEPGWISTGHSLARRSAWESVGGQDRNIFIYGEEIIFCQKLRDHNFKIKFVPYQGFIHHGSASQRSESDRFRKISWLTIIFIADLHWPLWQTITLRLLFLFRGLVLCGYKLIKKENPYDLFKFLPRLMWPIPLRNNFL